MHEQSETIERDGGWVNVYGKNTPKAGQDLPGEPVYPTLETAVAGAKARSAAAEPRTTSTEAPSLASMWDSIYKSVQQETEPARKKVEEAYKLGEQTFKGTVLPAAEGVKTAAGAPSPPLPKTIPQPPVPNLKPRSFLSGEGKEALPQLVAGMSHLATTIMGARNAPQAGLFALTGAMTGWAEGDQIRADRSWREYLGYVDNAKRENDQAWTQWEAAMATNATNLTRAQAQFAVAAVEAKMPEYAIAAAERGMQAVEKDLTTTRGIVDMLQKNALTVSRDQFNEWAKRQHLAIEREKLAHQKEQEGATDLDPATLKGIAESVQRGVPMSNFSFGMGKKAAEARIKILNAIFSDPNSTPEGLAQAQQMYKSLQAALTKNLTMSAQIGSFITTTRSVMERAKEASKTQALDGAPVFNKWVQAGRIQIEGDPAVTQFDVLNGTVALEWSRAINSATGGGVSTVEAREYALSKLSTAYTPKQYAAVMDTLSAELDDRGKGFVAETKRLQDALGQIGPKAVTRVSQPYVEGKRYKGSDGKTYTFTGGKMVAE